MKRRAFVAGMAAEVFIPKVIGAQQPKAVQRIGLIVNVKVAEALGLTIPPSLLARADEITQ